MTATTSLRDALAMALQHIRICAPDPTIDAALDAALSALSTPPAGEWMPIASAPKNRQVLAGYWNKLGKWRTVRATYYASGTLEAHEDYSDDADDEGFATAGWYEECESSEFIQFTDEPPTHWQPLPPPPATQEVG